MQFPFVRSIFHFAEIDSTSDEARRLVERGLLKLPSLVWANRQTKGRGQRSNIWWSDGGSLTATVILDPSDFGLAPETLPRVALASGVAVVEAIAERYPGCPTGLRWPNDVEVDGRKLGGILCERVGSALLIGIGVNVGTRLEDAPTEVRAIAASLAEWDETMPSANPRFALLGAILGRLPSVLLDLASGGPTLVERWRAFDTLVGSKIVVEVGDERIGAIAAGIDESGALRLDQDGEIRTIRSGRVLR